MNEKAYPKHTFKFRSLVKNISNDIGRLTSDDLIGPLGFSTVLGAASLPFLGISLKFLFLTGFLFIPAVFGIIFAIVYWTKRFSRAIARYCHGLIQRSMQ